MGDRPSWLVPVIAAGLCLASLALFWPGFALYDTVAQYGQVVSGSYDDWHPPAMARTWALLAPLGHGQAPMFLAQMALYWLGFTLIAAALMRTGRRAAGWAVVVIALLPPFLGWQAVVLKDAQMTGAMLAAAGLAAWWRLRRQRVPAAGWGAIIILLAYATLVRANAVFATVPLVIMLAPRPARWWTKAIAGLALTGAVLAVSPLINHRLLGATPTGVERTEALFDMAGIAARVPAGAGSGLTPPETDQVVRRHCSTPFFWDPLGDEDHCDATMDRLRGVAVGRLYLVLAAAALRHPIAYIEQRAGHLNSTDRWLVPAFWPSAAPPQGNEPNNLGLADPGALAVAWQVLGGWVAETPLGWPIAWIVVAATVLSATWRRRDDPACAFAAALAVSALVLEASFAALSIASDLRYHLWSMIAAALALVLAAGEVRRSPRCWRIGSIVLIAVVLTGGVARAVLPTPPGTYAGMLG